LQKISLLNLSIPIKAGKPLKIHKKSLRRWEFKVIKAATTGSEEQAVNLENKEQQ